MSTQIEPRPRESATNQPRVDLYSTVHRGLRLALSELMLRLGNADPEDARVRTELLDDLESVLYLMERHLEHEERHIHPLLVGPLAQHGQALTQEHEDHLEDISQVRQVAQAWDTDQSEAALDELYLRFSLLVGHNLAHMAHEEMIVNPALQGFYSDAELGVVHEHILAAIGSDEMRSFLRVMLPAARPAAREPMRQVLDSLMPASQRLAGAL